MVFTETLNVWGVNVILLLQRMFPSSAEFLMMISQVGDPSLAFTFYLPLTAALSLSLGTSLLWTLIVCEWVNMILKWVVAGDRPYWWVHESPYYLDKSLPFIRQFPLTCETGPGMPSGHSTLNAALFFIIVSALVSYVKPHIKKAIGEKKCVWATRIIWLSYVAWISLVMMSRIYMGTHFPHQCIVGAIIGIGSAIFVSGYKSETRMTVTKSIGLTSFILGSVAAVFGIYKALGNNPMWSVTKAVRWCMNRKYIHVDSIPFYSLSRYSGHALGLGLALASPSHLKIQATRFSWKMTLSLLILNVATGQACSFLHRFLSPTFFGYYPLEFILNASLAYLIISLLPRFVMSASGVKPKVKSKKSK